MSIINHKIIVNLQDLGLNSRFFRFNVLTMESCRHLCLKDISSDGTQQLAIVDIKEANVIKKHMKGESAILNPAHFTICIKGQIEGTPGHYVQVFNLDYKIMLSDYKFDEYVVYWKWLSIDEIAIVTEFSVYHWKVNPEIASKNLPEKIFDRVGKLKDENIQIINYQSDPTRQWCLLSSISTEDQGRTMNGHMMLYSINRRQHQILQGHAGTFGKIKSKTGDLVPVLAFVEKKPNSMQKLYLMDIFSQSFKLTADFELLTDPSDFPVSTLIHEKLGVITIVTKCGYLFIHDTLFLDRIHTLRISTDTIFAIVLNDINTDELTPTSTMVNKSGHVIEVRLDGRNMVQYLRSNASSKDHFFEISTTLMRVYGLPGDEADMKKIFYDLFQKAEYKRAATIAASTPSLRSRDTIQMFKQAKAMPGEAQPILQYFTVLLDHGRLDEYESLELIKPVVAQKKVDVIQRLFNANNLTPSKSLGDMIKQVDTKIALSVYIACKAFDSAINTLIERGDVTNLVAMAQLDESNYQNGELTFKGGLLLSNILSSMSTSCPERIGDLLQMLRAKGAFNMKNISEAPFNTLISCGRLQDVTSFLLDLLKDNNPNQGHLQTFLLSENLKRAPQIAEHLFNMSIFTHYDKSIIGPLAESVGMSSIALQCYNSIEKVKSLLLNNPNLLKPQLLMEMLSSMPCEDAISLVEFVVKNKILPCSDVVNSINRQSIGISDLYRLAMSIEDYGSPNELYILLKRYIQLPGTKYTPNSSLEILRESELHFKLISSATASGDLNLVELICKTSNSINPDKVKAFFKGKQEFKRDPRAFIYLADRFSYYDELASLLSECDPRFMQVYLSRMNRDAAPKMVRALIDSSIDETKFMELLSTLDDDQVESVCAELSSDKVVPEIMYKMLESRNINYRFVNTLTMLAKLSIIKGTADHYLTTLTNYDREDVVEFCRDTYPEYAFIAYKGDPSLHCQMVELAFDKGLYSSLAKHALEAQDLRIWSLVLNHAKSDLLISELTSNALPKCKNSQHVSVAIKAMMDAKLSGYLLSILDRLILGKTGFSDNRNLQNLLLVTALREKSNKLESYIDVCTNCDVNQVAKLALDLGEIDHALNLYIKSGNMAEAVRVMLDKGDLEGAAKLANQVNDRLIYGCVAESLLVNDLSMAIEYFTKSGDPSYYSKIVEVCKERRDYQNLIKYLTGDANKLKSYLSLARDTDLAYAYAFSGDVKSLEEFINGKYRTFQPDHINLGENNANLNLVGDAIFSEDCSMAKILYRAAKNHHSLALCHIKLGEFKEAVDASILSTLPHIKLEVGISCLENNHLTEASRLIAELEDNLNLLEKLANKFDELGFHREFMHRLAEYTSKIDLSGPKNNVVTLLAIYLVRHSPLIVFDFIKKYINLLYGDKLVSICETYYMFKESAFIYARILHDYDKSANVMINRFGLAWDHELIVTFISELSRPVLQDVILFYIDNIPNLLPDILRHVHDGLDMHLLVSHVTRRDLTWLIRDYLEGIQSCNISSVNNALNGLYVDICDHNNLERSINLYDSFDQNALLLRLKSHKMVEMKRVAATIYYSNKSYKQCLQVSLETGNYRQALLAASQTDLPIVHQLMGFFITKSLYAEFIACYCICYHLVDPTLVMELIFNKKSQDYDLYEFSMPFIIQTMSTINERLLRLEKRLN